MERIIEEMKLLKNFEAGEGASKEQIEKAEGDLNLNFSPEYCAYLEKYGNASYYGHILTGISSFPALNVVDVTKEERTNNTNIDGNFYVIERAPIDGIVIWQSQDGKIYQSIPNTSLKPLCNTLLEYINLSKVE